MTQEQFYREQRERMTSKESCNSVVKDIAIKFARWESSSDFCSNYWRQNRVKFEPRMGVSMNDIYQKAHEELFDEFIKSL